MDSLSGASFQVIWKELKSESLHSIRHLNVSGIPADGTVVHIDMRFLDKIQNLFIFPLNVYLRKKPQFDR